MKIVKFDTDFYDTGVVKFAAGQYYPLNSETQSLVDSGHAAMVDADDPAEPAVVLAALAKIARERADAAQAQATELIAAADAAQSLATAAATPAADPVAA